MNKGVFVKQIYDAARSIGLSDVAARVAASQAALESSYGARAPGNNYFGIKGKGQTLSTKEGGNGTLSSTKASFRTYGSMEESVADWARQMQRNWPGVLTATTYTDAINELNNGRLGAYATDGVEKNDPLTYQDKLAKIADTYLPSMPQSDFNTMALAGMSGRLPPLPIPRPDTPNVGAVDERLMAMATGKPVGTPPGTQLNLTTGGTVAAPSGQIYKVGDKVRSSDGTHWNKVEVGTDGMARFVRQPNPGEIPGFVDPYKSVGNDRAHSLIGGYINSKPEIAGPLTIAKGMGLTGAEAANPPAIPTKIEVPKAAADFGKGMENLGTSVFKMFTGNGSSSPPVPPKPIPDAAYNVTRQNMGITPPPVSRAPVSVPTPSPQPTQAQLQAMRAVPSSTISTPPLAPGLTAQQKYAMSALPQTPAIPPMPTPSTGPTQAQLQAMRAVGPSAYLMPNNYMPPSVPPSIVPTPTLEPTLAQKVFANTTIGKAVNLLSGGGPQVNDPNEAMRRNIKPITYNFAPVKAAGQAYDVMGRDLAFMPKSVQTSSRWNTGY